MLASCGSVCSTQTERLVIPIRAARWSNPSARTSSSLAFIIAAMPSGVVPHGMRYVSGKR